MEKDFTRRAGQRFLRYLLGVSSPIARLSYGVRFTICNGTVAVTKSGVTISRVIDDDCKELLTSLLQPELLYVVCQRRGQF